MKKFFGFLLQLSFQLDNFIIDQGSSDVHCSYVVMETKHRTKAVLDGPKVTCPLPDKKALPMELHKSGG